MVAGGTRPLPAQAHRGFLAAQSVDLRSRSATWSHPTNAKSPGPTFMRLPAAYRSVTLDVEPRHVPYPPLGFYSIAEHELGNGDCFGLYWPIGREDHEPIVAETFHDEWSI